MASLVLPTYSPLISVSQSDTPPEATAPTAVVNSMQPPESVAPLKPQPDAQTEDETRNVSENAHHINTNSIHQNISRLPKLSLPLFSGDPLMWQMFWDSFNVAVHSNPNLSGVQKFNYLRAQLRGDATRVVAGFPITAVNYQHSIVLLRERFGQPYKLINAHMQALLKLTNATNTLSSLQSFYNTVY